MKKEITFHYYWRRGDTSMDVTVPACWEICSECQGDGTELRGGMKGAVYSADDFAEDPDFAEDYFGGRYDVPCSCCHGTGKELVPDETRMTKRQKILWKWHCIGEAEAKAEERQRRYDLERGRHY